MPSFKNKELEDLEDTAQILNNEYYFLSANLSRHTSRSKQSTRVELNWGAANERRGGSGDVCRCFKWGGVLC